MATAESILKKHSLRVTSFRCEVINIFIDSKHALSNNDIEKFLDEPDRITLYRTLKNFEDKGIIHKAIDGTSTPKFALCEAECTEHSHLDEHVHFRCESCNNTFCIESLHIPELNVPKGYKVTSANMVLNGLCKDCN